MIQQIHDNDSIAPIYSNLDISHIRHKKDVDNEQEGSIVDTAKISNDANELYNKNINGSASPTENPNLPPNPKPDPEPEPQPEPNTPLEPPPQPENLINKNQKNKKQIDIKV